MLKNTLIAGVLFVGTVFALYGNTVILDKDLYEKDVVRLTMFKKGIGAIAELK